MSTPPALTPEQVRAFAYNPALFSRARALVKKGAIVEASRRERFLLGKVKGSAPLPYSVVLEPPVSARGRHWGITCTCAYYEYYFTYCKHSLALLYLWATQPDRFVAEPTLDEWLAGVERAAWRDLIRESLKTHPILQPLFELMPERRKPLKRAINLDPFREQVTFALQPKHPDSKQANLIRGLLQTAAGYTYVGDEANAARLSLLLVEELLSYPKRGPHLARLLDDCLLLLELALVSIEEDSIEWLAKVMAWWADQSEPALLDRLLDLILHCYQTSDEKRVVKWLRAELRRPLRASTRKPAWRERIFTYLMTLYQQQGNRAALLDLYWEEGDDAHAALEYAKEGKSRDVLGLALGGLGSAATHQQVAEQLAPHDLDAALQVAEKGLMYQDLGRPALRTWLAQSYLKAGRAAAAHEQAVIVWRTHPSVSLFQLLQASTPTTHWQSQYAALLAELEAQPDLQVEILLSEGKWAEAAALLPTVGPRRTELTHELARQSYPSEAVLAMTVLGQLATDEAKGGTATAYQQAIRTLTGAFTIAEGQGYSHEFEKILQSFIQNHRRRSSLLAMVRAAGWS